MKRKQVIKEVLPIRLEKALLMNKNIHLTVDFGFRTSVWIPKGDKTKMFPKVSLVLSAGTNDFRLVANNVEELQQALIEVISFLEQNKEEIEKVKTNEQEIFIQKIKEEQEKNRFKELIDEKTEAKIIYMKKNKAI